MDLLQKYSPDKQIENYAFSLSACIGKGSSGTVYVGRHQQTQQVVAIKAVDMRSLKTEYAWKMLCSEVKIMKKLKHPHVVRLLDVFQTKNNTYIITEFCNQGDLRTYLKKKKQLTERESITVISQIMSGLQELANNGIIHRDLKPANILIHDDIFKITDFGFAKKLDSMEDQLMDSLVGTPLYMAPQILNKQQYTSKCDVWSVGLILYELLYGRTPWPAVNVVDLVQKMCTIPLHFPKDPQVTQQLTNFISKCLQFPEADRISIQEMCANQLFEDYVQQINRLLSQQKLQHQQSGGTSTNTNSNASNNLSDFASVVTQVQNGQKGNQNNNATNEPSTPGLQTNNRSTKQSQLNQQGNVNSALPQQDTRSYGIQQQQQQGGTNLGVTPSSGMNLQINLNIHPQPPQQSSSMSPVRVQQPASGRNTDRNAIIQDQSGGLSPMKQISNMNEPYSPISPVRANYQKQSSASSHHQQAKSMSTLQEQMVQGNIINTSQKNMSSSKQNHTPYHNQSKNYPSSFHNLNTVPSQEHHIQSSEGSSNQNNQQQQNISNNYLSKEREGSPVKGGSYNEANFYQLLNNANNNERNQIGGSGSGEQQNKIYNENGKNQVFGYSSSHSKQNSSNNFPLSNQPSSNNQMNLQKQYTNEGGSSPSTTPPIPQYSPYINQNSPPLQYQQKPEVKAEVMSNNNQQNLSSPYIGKQQDSNERKFQERGFFLQQVQDQSPISNQNSEQKNGGLYLQQQISQPYGKTQEVVSGNQDYQSNAANQNKYDESGTKQSYIKQYSLQYQYQINKQNGQSEYNTQAATPNRNISPQSHSKNQSAFTSEKNSSSEQSPSSSINQQAGQYSTQQQQPQVIQNRYSQHNNSNSASGYSTVVKSGDHSSNQEQGSSRQNSPSTHNPTQLLQQQQSMNPPQNQIVQIHQQQNVNFQQLQQQRSGGDSPEGRHKTYSFTASNGFYSNKSGGALNNTNTSTRSITATNNSNSSPKNGESESKNSFNSTGYHSHHQQQTTNTRNPSSTLPGYANADQAEIAAYKNMKPIHQHQSSGSRKDFESVIQAPNESNGTNLNHQNIPYLYKRSMTQHNDQSDLQLDNSKNTFTPKNNGGTQMYNNYQNMQGVAAVHEFRNISPSSAAQHLLKKNKDFNDLQQLPRSPLQRRRKSEFGIGLQNKNITFQKEIKNVAPQQFSQNQIQQNPRNQLGFQIQNPQIGNLMIQNDEDERRNQFTPNQNQYNRSRSLHHNMAKQSSNNTQISPGNNAISPKYQNSALSEVKRARVSPTAQDNSLAPATFFGNNHSPKAQTKYQAYLQSAQQIKNQLGVNQPQNNLSAQKQLPNVGQAQQRQTSAAINNQEQQQQQQIQLQKQMSSQGTESSPYKYSKYALKHYLQTQSNVGTSSTNNNNSYAVIQNNNSTSNNNNNNSNITNNIPNYTSGSNSNIGLKVYSAQENIGSTANNKQYISQQPSTQLQGNRNQAVGVQPHHGHSKSLTTNNFSSVMTAPNSQQEIAMNENSSNASQNEFYGQDNMIESILCLCKSVRFLKNQIDYNIKSILKLEEPFLYEKLIFLLNKHLVIQISMLKITQMDKGINVINLDRWTEYRASQNFNEIYKKIAQNYYDIISTHQNNWNRAHENQRFYDEAKKDYYFSKIFNQQLTQYNNTGSGQNTSNQNTQSSDEDNTNFYFYIYQLLKEIIKEVFNKLQQNLARYLDLDNSKITREDSLIINCLSRLVDYHQLLKLIISQKEDFSLILKSINITEFLKEKIITIEFYEALKQKMYIYDLITK